MSQTFRDEFYKEVQVNGRGYYLYKMYEKWNDGKEILAWISAYKKKEPETWNFVVESGAGIKEERMIKQIMGYLEKVSK